MEAIKVSEKIQQHIIALEKAQAELEKEVADKNYSKAKSAYDGAIEKAIHELQQGMREHYGKVPVTIIKDIARGLCKDKLAEVIQAELRIKVLNSRIDVLKACLNGWQSVNRYLDST